MNKTFALVWSDTRGGWVAASECARQRGKSAGGLRLSAVALALLGAVGLAQAQDLPKAGVIQHGTGEIAVDADKKTMRIQQKTDKMIIDWQRFDIGEGKQVIFDQPGRSSAVLNKVLGMYYSHINGALTSNGRVFLINPNGIYFGSSSQVKVGDLVASTKLVSDDDFLGDGLMRFSGRSNASILNDGSITAEDGGSVVMLSEGVINFNHIRADRGVIALGSGQAFILGFGGNSMLDLQVERGAIKAIVDNMGILQANGGKVLLKGRSADGVGALVVNNGGLIEARSLNGKSGAIVLDGGDSAQIDVGGKLIATGGDGVPGGTVSLKAKSVLFRPDVLIDTRAASGNNGLLSIISPHISVARDAYAAGPGTTLAARTLNKNLETNNVSLISTAGDVAIHSPLQWDNGSGLSFQAARHVHVNAPITAKGNGASVAVRSQEGDLRVNAHVRLAGDNAALAMIAKSNFELGRGASLELSGKGATYETREGRYTVINDVSQWESMNQDLAGRYALGKSLEGGGPMATIGNDQAAFTGEFEGLGHTLSKFEVSGNNHAGLFAQSSGNIRNLNLSDISVTTAKGAQSPIKAAGALVGTHSGTITNVHATGSQLTDLGAGHGAVGGLVGRSNEGQIERSSVTASTLKAKGGRVGGLIGDNNGGFISESRAEVAVHVSDNVHAGGFAGYNGAGGTLYNVQARGALTHSGDSGNGHFGGLVGANDAIIAQSAAFGNVHVQSGSAFSVGGLAGYNGGTIDNVTASGHVSGGHNSAIGGLVGYNNGKLTQAEAKGNVSGRDWGDVGALVGVNRGTIHQAVARGSARGEFKSRVGGLAGRNLVTGEIMGGSAYGEVSGGLFATLGGLAGENAGLIHQSHARNSVNHPWWLWLLQTRGPVAGHNSGTIW